MILVSLLSEGNQLVGKTSHQGASLGLLDPGSGDGILAVLGSKTGADETCPAGITTSCTDGHTHSLHIVGTRYKGMDSPLQAVWQTC